MTVRALTACPSHAGTADVRDMPEPSRKEGLLLVEGLLLGVCGTDREIVAGSFGRPPQGRQRMIIGHESLGRVREAPSETGFEPGDLVVGVVRHPDPEPCEQCAAGEPDLCTNGRYTERGVAGQDGYGADSYRLQPARAIKVSDGLGDRAVLLEPASIVAKAFEQIAHVADARELWQPRSALILGAGPIGLLAALACAERGMDLHVLDRVTEGAKPGLVRRLGGEYHTRRDSLSDGYDLTLECSGTAALMIEALRRTAPTGTACLIGIPSSGEQERIDLGALYRRLVLANQIVIATMTANRRHFQEGLEMLERADRDWLASMITRRLPLACWQQAFNQPKDQVKTVLTLGGRH